MISALLIQPSVVGRSNVRAELFDQPKLGVG